MREPSPPTSRDGTAPRSGDALQKVWKRLAAAAKLPTGAQREALEQYGTGAKLASNQ